MTGILVAPSQSPTMRTPLLGMAAAVALSLFGCQATAPTPEITADEAATDEPIAMPPPGTPFPAWLFTDERQQKITDSHTGDDYQDQVFDGRFILTIRKEPHTGPGVSGQWSYLDCETYWTATEQMTTEGKWRQWATAPEEAFNPENHRKLSEGICDSWGL